MIVLKLDARTAPAATLEKLTALAAKHPGTYGMRLELTTDRGTRLLALGWSWGYSGDERCLNALRDYGDVEVIGA